MIISMLLLLLLLSHFSRVQLCVTPETAAHQAPLSLGFSRQELEWVATSAEGLEALFYMGLPGKSSPAKGAS